MNPVFGSGRLSCFVGDPAAIGATRIHVGSTDESLQIATQSCVLWRRVGVRIRACGVATSLRRIERRRRSPIGNYAWKIWRGAAPLIRCTQDRAIPLTGQDHMIATVGRRHRRQDNYPTHWKQATRHSCHNRPPCRRFSNRHLCPILGGIEARKRRGLDTKNTQRFRGIR